MHQCHQFQHVFSTCLILNLFLRTLHNQAVFLNEGLHQKHPALNTWDPPSPHVKESSKPGLLSPGERQNRKATKEREKQRRALKHPPLPPGNQLIPNMPLKMTFREDQCTGTGGPSVLGDTLQTPLLKAKCREMMQQPCLRRGHCTQPVPQRLPGTVIWMMSSSSGSILICLIPPSSPEVPTGERQ